MRAIDTNVLARFIIHDDPVQAGIARRLIAEGVFVPVTVLLETAWLLRSRYGMDRATVAGALRTIIAMASVEITDADRVAWAILRIEHGADIADMLHLIAARPATSFATFDQGIAPAAGPETPIPIETL